MSKKRDVDGTIFKYYIMISNFGKPVVFPGLLILTSLIAHTQFSSAAQLEHMSIASSDTDPTCPKLKNDASSPLLQAKSFSTLMKFQAMFLEKNILIILAVVTLTNMPKIEEWRLLPSLIDQEFLHTLEVLS